MTEPRHGNVAIFVPHQGCPHRCSFCDQRTISGASAAPTPTDVRVACEAALAARRGDRRLELAFFGGSFTAIDEKWMCALLAAAQDFLGEGKLSGIRVSTRPDAVDPHKLALLRRYGVTAIELGAQSMNDAVLTANGRGHTAEDTVCAAEQIRAQGFELGLQMMVGLDGEDASDPEHTARALIALSPDTVRIYPVLVLRGTELARRYERGEYRPLTLSQAVEQTTRLMELFEQADIRIIRVGLHPTPQLERGLIAGPYHPAFRELCESAQMLERLRPQLAGRAAGVLTVAVAPQDVSRMIGQHGGNRRALQQLGWDLHIVQRVGEAPLSPKLLQREAVQCD